MKKVFLSHRIDFLSIYEALEVADWYKAAISDEDHEMVSMAYDLEMEAITPPSDKEIVEKCLAALGDCRAVVFDCSEEDWTYIGCIFEVVYAHNLKLPVFTYTGNTSHSRRPWLRYHSTEMFEDRLDLVRALKSCLSEAPPK